MKRVLAVAGLILASAVCAFGQSTTNFNGIVRDLTQTPILLGNVAFTLKPGIDTTISGNARFTPTTVNCPIEAATIVSATGNGTSTTVSIGGSQPWQIGDVLIITGTGTVLDNLSVTAGGATLTGASGGNTFTFLDAYNGTVTQGTIGGIFAASGTGKCLITQNSALNPAYTSYSVSIQVNPGSGLVTTSQFNAYAIGTGPVDLSTVVPTPAQEPTYSFVDTFSNGQNITGYKNFTNSSNTFTGGTFNSPTINSATFNTTTATNWTITTPTINAPTFNTQPITLIGSAGNNYSVAWSTPAASRTLTIPDPGGSDTFAFLAATQTLTNKTLGSGTVISKPPTSVNGSNTVGDYGVVPVTAKVDLTAQNTSLGPTGFFTYTEVSSQSLTLVSFTMVVRATGTGTVTLQIEWTDCNGVLQIWEPYNAYSTSNGTINLANSGVSQSGTTVACMQSGSALEYVTTDSNPGSGSYDLHLRAALE